MNIFPDVIQKGGSLLNKSKGYPTSVLCFRMILTAALLPTFDLKGNGIHVKPVKRESEALTKMLKSLESQAVSLRLRKVRN